MIIIGGTMSGLRYNLSILLVIVFGSFVFSEVNAQQLQEKDNGEIELTFDKPSAHFNAPFRAKTSDLDNFWTIDPIRTWGHTQPFSDPQINFAPGGISTLVGDLNGDGEQDFIRVYNTADERTEDISDFTFKTMVFFGPSNHTEAEELIYDRLIPIGDILGSGKAQLISQTEDGLLLYDFEADGSYNTTSVSIPELADAGLSITALNILFKDLDDNGTQDVAAISGGILYVGLIADPVENSTVTEFNLADTLAAEGLNPDDFNIFTNLGNASWMDTEYFYVPVFSFSEGSFGVMVLSYNSAENSIAFEQTMFLPNVTSNIRLQLAEDGDGFPNILAAITFGDPIDTYLFTKDESETNIYADSVSQISEWPAWVIGDLDGDGAADFVVEEEGVFNFATLTEDTVLASQGALGFADNPDNFISIPTGFMPQGDLSGDGMDDLQYRVSNADNFGQLRIEGVAEGNSPDIANPVEMLYNASEFRVTRIERTFGLSDLTGNGLDEYAFIVSDGLSGQLDVYEGGSDGSTPIYTIELDGFVQHVTSGDFNTEGREDILMLISINVEVDGVMQRSNELHFYEMGAEDPYHVIKGEDYIPGLDNYNNFIGTMANAGDINNDGLDDVLVAAPFWGNNPIGVYLGGATISTNPDHEISFPEEDGLNYTFNWGGTLQGGFDINGDGISDFLIGNNGEYDSNTQPNSNPINDGVVHVYYGHDGEIDFSSSDVQLRSDTSAHGNNIFYWFFGFNEIAEGDFNGDGSTDLAVKPFRHHDNADITLGKPGIHIFHGGDDFDGHADQIIPLLKEVHHPTRVGEGNEFHAFSGRAYIAAVPDVNDDGADELLYMGNQSDRNGSFFFGGDSLAHEPDAVLRAPNQSFGFNQNGNFINRQFRMPIGEFTAEGVTAVLAEQPGDRNFRDTPAYLFELTQTAVSTEEKVADVPENYRLEQNYPNPFNPATKIQFNIPRASDVKLTVYNILGQEVMTIVDSFKQAGTHTAVFDAQSMASGIYIYRLEAGSVNLQRKMTLIK